MNEQEALQSAIGELCAKLQAPELRRVYRLAQYLWQREECPAVDHRWRMVWRRELSAPHEAESAAHNKQEGRRSA